MHVHFGPGDRLQVGSAAGMVRVAVGEQDVFQIIRLPADGCEQFQDLAAAVGLSRVYERQLFIVDQKSVRLTQVEFIDILGDPSDTHA